MIYIKIYLDQDENGEDMLVFDSVKQDDEKAFFTVAGKKENFSFGGKTYPWFDYKTKVIGVEQVAISPEAKELFTEMLNDESLCRFNPYSPDFEILGCHQSQYGWNTGMFAFVPENIENNGTTRTLRRGKPFTAKFGDAKSEFEYMVICDNETLKSLDLAEPAEKKTFLDAYYAAMRAKGEELSCDIETIRKTPVDYMTEAQKDVIRADYRRMINSYDSQEWHDNGDFLDDKIESEIIQKYLILTGGLNKILNK